MNRRRWNCLAALPRFHKYPSRWPLRYECFAPFTNSCLSYLARIHCSRITLVLFQKYIKSIIILTHNTPALQKAKFTLQSTVKTVTDFLDFSNCCSYYMEFHNDSVRVTTLETTVPSLRWFDSDRQCMHYCSFIRLNKIRQTDDGSSSRLPVLCISRCLVGHQRIWLLTSNWLSIVVAKIFVLPLTGSRRFSKGVGHFDYKFYVEREFAPTIVGVKKTTLWVKNNMPLYFCL